MDNPWYVDSIEAFACLKCPECVFNTKENKVFQNHAVETHPLYHVLFGAPKTVSDSSIVVLNYDRLTLKSTSKKMIVCCNSKVDFETKEISTYRH